MACAFQKKKWWNWWQLSTIISSFFNLAIHLRSIGATDITAASRISTTSLPNSLGSSTTEPDLTDEEVRKKPWKYIGYKGYSSFLASEKDLCVLGRFTSVNIRVSLALQDQVVALEEELDELDDRYSRRSAQDIDNGTFRGDIADRTALLETITQKLSQYSKSRDHVSADQLTQFRCSCVTTMRTRKTSITSQTRHWQYSEMAQKLWQ